MRKTHPGDGDWHGHPAPYQRVEIQGAGEAGLRIWEWVPRGPFSEIKVYSSRAFYLSDHVSNGK